MPACISLEIQCDIMAQPLVCTLIFSWGSSSPTLLFLSSFPSPKGIRRRGEEGEGGAQPRRKRTKGDEKMGARETLPHDDTRYKLYILRKKENYIVLSCTPISFLCGFVEKPCSNHHSTQVVPSSSANAAKTTSNPPFVRSFPHLFFAASADSGFSSPFFLPHTPFQFSVCMCVSV